MNQVVYQFATVSPLYERGDDHSIEAAKEQFFYKVSSILGSMLELDLTVVYKSQLLDNCQIGEGFTGREVFMLVAYIFDKPGLTKILKYHDLGNHANLAEVLNLNHIKLIGGVNRYLELASKLALSNTETLTIHIVKLEQPGN